jgi:glycosyltransferase involved in cell wall biosynthesis
MNVFIIPKNHEYIRQLKLHLEQLGTKVVLLKPFHYATFSNIAKLLVYRLSGIRLIHVHWLYIFPLSVVMKAFYVFCRLTGIKIIWEMHNILPHGYSERDKNDSAWFYEKADGIIFHSRHDIMRCKSLYATDREKPHIVIPHGNFNDSYVNTISKNAARDRLSVPAGNRVILCFGFIRKNRGYEYLVEATKNMSNTTVLVAGKLDDKTVFSYLQNVEKKMSHVKLHVKWIPDDEIQVYFNSSDIVVLPYTEITTSGVIPLAYAFSRPVVTTDIGGIRDIVTADTGILVPPENAEALKQAIERIFRMDYTEMGKKACDYARKEFSWQSNARKIAEFYASVVSQQKNPH